MDTRKLGDTGIGEVSRENTAPRLHTPRIGEREAIDEDHGIIGGRVAHVLDQKAVDTLDENAGQDLEVEFPWFRAAPELFAQQRSVQEDADVVVRIAREVTSTLEP